MQGHRTLNAEICAPPYDSRQRENMEKTSVFGQKMPHELLFTIFGLFYDLVYQTKLFIG